MPSYPTWEQTLVGKTWRNVHFPRIKEDIHTFLGLSYAVNEEDIQGADVVINWHTLFRQLEQNTAA